MSGKVRSGDRALFYFSLPATYRKKGFEHRHAANHEFFSNIDHDHSAIFTRGSCSVKSSE
jgi:hypothetical protein